MIERQIESPMPSPSDFVVKKGSKIRFATASSSPGPVSSTATSTAPGSASAADTDSSRVHSVTRTHGFNAVYDQVQQHLLQLNPVTEDRPFADGEVSVQHDALPLQLGADERQHFPDGVVDVEPRQFRPGFPGERSQAADDVARLVAAPQDARDRVPRFVKIRLLAVQPSQAGVGVGRDGGEGLVDLMGNGGDQFAHGRQPRDAGEFRLSVSQRLIGVSAFRDVHDRADEFEVAGLRDVGLTHVCKCLTDPSGRTIRYSCWNRLLSRTARLRACSNAGRSSA